MIDTSGPAEWSASYAQFLLRAAHQSTRALDLHYSVLQRVSRGELSPAAVGAALSELTEIRGRVYAERTAELSARFFGGLLQIAGGASDAPPPYAEDSAAWFGSLAEYAAEIARRALQAFQHDVECVATGRRAPHELQQAMAADHARRTPAQVRAIGRLYFELLSGLADSAAAFEDEYLRAALMAADPSIAGAPLLQLTASIGETAAALLSLENTRPERAAIRCIVADVRRADGVGPAFVPTITVDPDALSIDPGREASVRLTLTLDAAMYEPDTLYVGAVHVIRHGEPRLDVPLRIISTGPAAAGVPRHIRGTS